MKRFAVGFAAGVVLALAFAVLPAALVDPTGYLTARWPQKIRVCEPNISADERVSKMMALAAIRPREVLIGTSRVGSGFDEDTARRFLVGPVMNLGLGRASMAEMEVLFAESVHSGRLQRAWIGVDFGLFAAAEAFEPISAPGNEFTRLVRATAAIDSVLHAYVTLVHPRRCRSPYISALGFSNARYALDDLRIVGWQNVVRRSNTKVSEHIEHVARGGVLAREALARARWNLLGRIVADARRAGTTIVLFVSPAHEYYYDAITRTGLTDEFSRWRADMAAFAHRSGVAFYDFSDDALIRSVDLERCNPTENEACPLYDVNHFRPAVGRKMLLHMLSSQHERMRAASEDWKDWIRQGPACARRARPGDVRGSSFTGRPAS